MSVAVEVAFDSSHLRVVEPDSVELGRSYNFVDCNIHHPRHWHWDKMLVQCWDYLLVEVCNRCSCYKLVAADAAVEDVGGKYYNYRPSYLSLRLRSQLEQVALPYWD